MTWLRCVDHKNGDEAYWLNARYVIRFRRVDDGQWWRAFDVRGEAHDISGEDDERVQALIDGNSKSPN